MHITEIWIKILFQNPVRILGVTNCLLLELHLCISYFVLIQIISILFLLILIYQSVGRCFCVPSWSAINLNLSFCLFYSFLPTHCLELLGFAFHSCMYLYKLSIIFICILNWTFCLKCLQNTTQVMKLVSNLRTRTLEVY